MGTEHTPPPWPEGLAIPIEAGDERYTFNGRPPVAACRVLSEADYQHARHCVNAHEKLLAACLKFLDTWKTAGPQGSGQFEKFDVVVREMGAAIANAEPPVQENPQSEPETP